MFPLTTGPLDIEGELRRVGTIEREHLANKGKINVGPDGGDFENVTLDAPIESDDWGRVFRIFQLNPDEFEVVGDTVRMSTWQQSKGTEDGGRDLVQLYSYSAKFTRLSKERIAPAIVAEWRAALRKSRAKRVAPAVDGGTYSIKIADPQFGKKRTAEAVDNYKRGVSGHLDAARALGSQVEALHMAWMGDETENVVNSYGNQPHTIELNRSQQLELDYDLRVWALKEALALGLPTSASSVISNHGEWTRNGGKEPVTSQGDNASTYIARQVKALFDELEPFTGQHVEWHIGGGDPGVTITLSGVECYFSHGYIEKGRGTSTETRTRAAIERQILGRTDELGKTALWFMAHYHHHYSNEFEGRTLFGCPAIEAERSSEYMLNQFGVWSPPGVLGMLVSEHNRRGWSNLNVF